MNILITGGAGFIGAHTAKKLIEGGDKVVIIDNFNNYYNPKLKEDRIKILLKGLKFKLYRGDIRDEKLLEKIFSAEGGSASGGKKEKIDKVVHLAAMAGVRFSFEKPLLYGEVNFMGTLNMLEFSRKYKIKNFVYASSSSVYGANKKIPFSESDRVDNPISTYAATKKATELMAYMYSHTHGLNTTGLRFFTVYGPWGRPDMAYFKFTNLIYNGKPIEVYNNGKMMRDFTYIDDIVDGIIRVLDADFQCEIMNIGADKPEKLDKFIKVLEKNIGKIAKKKMMPMQKGDVLKTMADIKKLKKLGWNPTTKIDEGIKKFIEWYKKYYKC
jgi:UDP-glucuronate 4-epimerase